MMIKADEYYIQNLNKVLTEGCLDENPRPKYKDGTPAHSKYITQVFETYDISKGEFPITTLRNTAVKTGIKEILWIYQKQDNSIIGAHKMGIKWWDEWDIGNGTIGQRYGATLKKWHMMDNLLNDLKNTPFSRRHIINMYQQDDINKTKGLYPCAYETIWTVRRIDSRYYLDMTLIQRSSDFITAKYINSSQYVALQMMVVGHLNLYGDKDFRVGKFCHLIQNLHIYDRHENAANEILNKTPLNIQPKIELIGNKDFYDYTINDFNITGIENITKIASPLELAI